MPLIFWMRGIITILAMRGIILCGLIVLFGCKDHKGLNDLKTDSRVLVNSLKDTLYISQFVDSISRIVLDVDSKDPIGEIIRVTKVDYNRLIVLGKAGNEKSLFLFEKDGRYLNKVGSQGRGPGEYVSLTSYVFDGANGIIHLYDASQMSIYKYNLDGSFLEKLKVDLIFEDFTITKTGNYIYYSPIEKKNMNNKGFLPRGIYLADRNGRYLSIIHTLEQPDNYQFFNQFFFTRSEISSNLLSSFDDRLYSFDANRLNTVIDIDFGKLKLPAYERGNTEIDELTAEYICAKSFGTESQRYLLFLTALSGSGTVRYCLIDKMNKSCTLYSTLVNDLTTDVGLFVGSCDNNFYFNVVDNSNEAVFDIRNKLLVFHLKQ